MVETEGHGEEIIKEPQEVFSETKAQLGFQVPPDASELGGLRNIIIGWQGPDFEGLIGEYRGRLEQDVAITNAPDFQRWQIGAILEIADLRHLRDESERFSYEVSDAYDYAHGMNMPEIVRTLEPYLPTDEFVE